LTLDHITPISKTRGLIIWTLLSRQLVVATPTKPNLRHLAPASEVAGRHTLAFLNWQTMPFFKMVRYVFLQPLMPELDGQESA
jgi:hypothetical protein